MVTSVGFEKLLGTDIPIIQAPMAGVQGSALAVAVCNAGGLGSLPCALLSVEVMRRELAAVRAGTTRPFNVNFFCHPSPAPDAAREAAWRATLAPYYDEAGIANRDPPPQPTRAPFDEPMADAIAEFEPPVVSFHFGLPDDALLARVRRWRPKILASATTVEEARWLEDRGVDVIIAQGVEAGGHRGMFLSTDVSTQVGTMALVPQLVDAVKVPVIAAGGIADPRGVAAAMALGAAGVQLGTAYLLASEATTSVVHRAALQSKAAATTAVTNVFTGRPARSIVNRLVRELGPLSNTAPAFPLAAAALGPLRARAESQGSGDFSPLWAGQFAAACQSAPAAAITHELARGLSAAG
jgi:nitronate monooxygenase